MAEQQGKSKLGKVLKGILIAVLVVFGIAALGILYLTVTEYKPADVEEVAITGEAAEDTILAGEGYSVMTWNIGYGALGDNADFFMDGGSSVRTADEERVQENLSGIKNEIASVDPDFLFLQEVDQDSDRSYHINEYEEISADLNSRRKTESTFANNYKVAFVPYPIPPIGKVDSGIATFSTAAITDAKRMQLPCPFTWPVRIANLKRCLLVDRVKVLNDDGRDTGKELVLVNLHLEAYDDGEGKAAQTAMLKELLCAEQEKGNYVIAGGDFNQIFSTVNDGTYPVLEGKWTPGEIDTSEFDDSWQFEMDTSVPTCRSLDRALDTVELTDPSNFQYYMIDGFICSSNVSVEELKTQDLGFENSDHNPVVMKFSLLPCN